ncbi:hypothetical protein MTR67_027984, partial [Solanum verrucosum]
HVYTGSFKSKIILFCVSSLPGTSFSQIRANRKLNPQSIPPHINTLLVLQNKAKISSKLRSCSHVTEIPISNAMTTQSFVVYFNSNLRNFLLFSSVLEGASGGISFRNSSATSPSSSILRRLAYHLNP